MFATLRPLAGYLVGHKRPLVWGFLAMILTDTLQLASPWVFKYAIDSIATEASRSALALAVGLLLGLAVVGGIARYFMRRLVIGTSREIEFEFRNDFFTKLSRLPFAFYNRTPTGDLMARATNDLNAIRMVVGPAIMYSANTVITLGAGLALMFVLSWQLALISLIPLPAISFFMYRYGRIIHKRFEAVQGQFSDITARAQEYLAGMRVVKAYTQESAALEDFRERNQEYMDRNMDLVKVQGLFSPAIGFLAGLGSMLVLGFGGHLVIEGRITLGTFVAFNSYLVMLIWPMIALGWVVSIFQRGAASMKRLQAVLQAPEEIQDGTGSAGVAQAGVAQAGGRGDAGVATGTGADSGRRGAGVARGGAGHGGAGEPVTNGPGIHTPRSGVGLTFDNVGFHYATRPDTEVLRGIDLEVRPGETVAITGHTGSGKTTLVNLVPRLYDPTSGVVRLSGVDLRELPVEQVRLSVGYVPQETFLFSRSVADNIALGRPEAVREEIERMARVARLANDVDDFPKGYETMVGERGVTLSGGQKQRTAIARALLRNPRILILDDALAAVDTRTEEDILSELRGFMEDRTTLLVAHRVSTVKLADRILVLENGAIAEQGTHEELLRKDGLYAELDRLQALEDELEATQ